MKNENENENKNKNNIKTLNYILILLFMCISLTPVQAEITNLNDAINKAGRQRMLTQRIVKAFGMLQLKVKTEMAQKQLNGALSLFASQLDELRNYKVNSEITDGLMEVDKIWRKFKPMAQGSISKEGTKQLRAEAEKLLVASHNVVLSLQDSSTSSSARLVNISGRQRMLSQRLANLYMLKAIGFDNARLNGDFDSAMSEFKGALSVLLDAKENTQTITTSLKKVKTQFLMLQYTVTTDSEEFIPGLIAQSTEKILIKMNEITGLYTQL